MSEQPTNSIFDTASQKHQKNSMKRLFMTHLNLAVIIMAALLLELTVGIMFYTGQSILQESMERKVSREMSTILLSIRSQLEKIEVTIDNMAWVVSEDLAVPDSMFVNARHIVENNPAFTGSSITFIPSYYPEKGRWFEPYAVRRSDGSIESMQLGSAQHDYTQMEFYKSTFAKKCGNWCEPYLDPDGAREIVTTYGAPVRDKEGRMVGMVDADIPLTWLDSVVVKSKIYHATRRFLVTGKRNLLVGEHDTILQAALELLNGSSSETSYTTMTDDDGNKLHVFFQPIGGKTDWMLISACYDSEVFGQLRMARNILSLLVLATLLLLAFIVQRAMRGLARLKKTNIEKERIASELRVASEIQQSMLPHNRLTDSRLDISGSLVPAREVGGDLYDFFIRNEKLFFCIGDVSGKGAPSAMLMAVTLSLFRFASTIESDPASLMRAINAKTCEGNDTNMFVTFFIGVLDLQSGILRFCNAGHSCPTLVSDRLRTADCKPHLPIGLFEDVAYTTREERLDTGTTIFLYTDGLTEAMDAQNKQFGKQRMDEVLAESTGGRLKPKDILDTMTLRIEQFVGDAQQSDDLTMLAIRYTPSDTSRSPVGNEP